MAELMDNGGGGKKGGAPKQKKKSTKVDMTAMVDVAFLLLTFFILTTTMASESMMQLNVPPKPKKDTPIDDTKLDVKESKMLTIILGDEDDVHFYFGDGVNNETGEPDKFSLRTTDFSSEGIRQTVMGHLYKPGETRCVGKDTKNCWDPLIVIKPMEQSRYKNLVDILDEMSITNARKYALTKLTEIDSTLLYMNLKLR